ncbi:MAG: hypothetical protein ACK4NO_01515 [Glycocaulis sp.]
MDDIQPFVDVLSSEQAIRVYIFATVALVYMGCAYQAYRSTSSLRSFLAAGFTFRVHGNVKRCDTIKDKLEELEDQGKNWRKDSIRQAVLILFFAVFVPGCLLVLLVYAAEFLFPGAEPLVKNTNLGSVSLGDIIIFVADQTLRGGLSDAFEVFDLRVTDIGLNPENTLFAAFVLVHRTLAGITGIVIGLLLTSTVFGQPAYKVIKERLERMREAACKADGS